MLFLSEISRNHHCTLQGIRRKGRSMERAEPLGIPDAQQVMTGFDLLILEKLSFRVSRGRLREPFK
jgi:hypothetical protein